MAREWKVKCKDCGKEFGYSDSSYQEGAVRGLSRPERCSDCRKTHNRQTSAMGLAYFPLKPRSSADTNNVQIGQLGAVSHEKRPHEIYELASSYDPEKFGITDEDVQAIFEWLSGPNHQVVVVEGPTGSGKSTVLPFKLISPPDGLPKDQFTRHGQVVITQPRIQATRNIPAYVAKELYGSNLGSGFDIGFRYSNNPASDWRNKLVYVTDGTLINWIVSGQIANLSVIMIDEAHERSLNIDLILGLLKKLLPRYPHLKLIIASATINADLFLDYFGRDRTAHIKFKGVKKHDVKEFYRFDGAAREIESNEYCPGSSCPPLPYDDIAKLRGIASKEIGDTVVWLLKEIAQGRKPPGDILAFLHGEKPIQDAVGQIRKAIEIDASLSNVYVCPLYTTLPQEEQNRALLKKSDPNMRRVVITTNVAETSLTVEDIIYVVESGLINEAQWDPQSQTKQVVPVLQSKAGCIQRWGRAGRITDGEAYCLYTKEQFDNLFPDYTIPQIQRSPLEQIVLTAKAAGIDDIENFDWIEKPPSEELKRAPQILIKKGALDEEGDLTEHGLELQAFAEEPSLANLMVVADRYCCAVEMATLLPMIKQGGMRHFLRWDRGWDAETRRKVQRIHESLMKGCRDDIEFCLKLYVAWSETEYDETSLDPQWSFLNEWVRYIPRLPDNVKEYLSQHNTLDEFRVAVEHAVTYNDLETTIIEFEVSGLADEWLTDAYKAMPRASREAWAKAFYINHSIFKDKIEPARKKLLEDLSGHKKDEIVRPVDLSLIDRIRIVLAYCLPERICEQREDYQLDSEENTETGRIYKLRGLGLDAEASDQLKMPVQINLDSVIYERNIETFVCCKQQVITHRLTPTSPVEPVIHSSFISLVEPSWLEWLSKPNPSPLALGRFISNETRDTSGALKASGTYSRLFVDLRFPIGSRYECEVIRIVDDQNVEVLMHNKLLDLPPVYEEYTKGEPDESASSVEIEEVEGSSSDLADTVLVGMAPPVINPEEDITPSWADLADDTYDIDFAMADNGNNASQPIVTNKLHKVISGDVPTCFLRTDGEHYEIGSIVVADVIDFDFADLLSPSILLSLVPYPEPIVVFLEQYCQTGASVPLQVIGQDGRAGDHQVALITKELNSKLEVLLEAGNLSFHNRGFVVREIPVGASLHPLVESCDPDRAKVRLSYLPIVEEHLNTILEKKRSKEGYYIVSGTVKEVFRDRVYLSLDWSEPEKGIIHVASAGGKGLAKPANEYMIGEVCQVRLQIQRYPAHAKCPNLPDEIRDVIETQRIFNKLSWHEGELSFDGRMAHSLRDELKATSDDKGYNQAIDTLYRFSNDFQASIQNPNWNPPEMGTRISRARVLRVVPFGAFVEIGPGMEGLVHKTEFSWTDAPEPEGFLAEDDLVEVIVVKVDSEKQEVGLSMKLPEQAPDYSKYMVGEVRKGHVVTIVEFGFFVELDPGVRGLLHKSEVWGHTPNTGEELSVKVTKLEPQERKISLSMKTPENSINMSLKVGEWAEGSVSNVKEDLGAFVMLDSWGNGLIHKSKMTRQLSRGEHVKVSILRIDTEKFQLGFGM